MCAIWLFSSGGWSSRMVGTVEYTRDEEDRRVGGWVDGRGCSRAMGNPSSARRRSAHSLNGGGVRAFEPRLPETDDPHGWLRAAARRPTHTHEVDADGDPMYLASADFAFVEEPSCIGCGLCVKEAPSTFFMESWNGRARAFAQVSFVRLFVRSFVR